MLKQQTFFKKIQEKKINPYDYSILLNIHINKIKLEPNQIAWLKTRISSEYITDTGQPTQKAINLMNQLDELFKPQKKLKSLDVLGPDGDQKTNEYLELFPEGKLPSGKYARTNKKNIQDNFIWFLQEYNYTWDIILDATERYVEEYRKKDFMYMRTAQYFIRKIVDGIAQSELANYCDLVMNQEPEQKEEKVFKQRVV